MSPYLAVERRTRTRRRPRGVMRTAPIVAMMTRRRRARVRGASPNYAVTLSGSTRYLGGYDDGLGFSLRPPKWARKTFRTIKRNITLKRALIGGAIVGAAFIPGVGPAALAAAKAAGRGVASVFRGTIGRAASGIEGLFKKKAAKYGPFPDQGTQTPSDQGTTQPSGQTTTSASGSGASPTYGPNPSGGGDSGTTTSASGGGASPTYGPAAPDYGSGADDSGDTGEEPIPMPEATATTDDTTQPAGANALPLILGGGALLLLSKRH